MRRTLAVLVTTAALLVPASAASADHGGTKTNASCNAKGGGNYARTHHEVKESDRDADCKRGGSGSGAGGNSGGDFPALT